MCVCVYVHGRVYVHVYRNTICDNVNCVLLIVCEMDV